MAFTRKQIVANLLQNFKSPDKQFGSAFAATNIALCKYWGKRDIELNLPTASSLSISLGHLGACAKVEFAAAKQDQIFLNAQPVADNTMFYRRIVGFLDLFRPTEDAKFKVSTKTNIPIAAGLASSACGFAALVKALQDFFAWDLNPSQLSILARMGSGSACRSILDGFVLWHRGERDDGMDSCAEQISAVWSELRVGILLVDNRQKAVSSTEGMQASVATSPFYPAWPATVHTAINVTQQAISDRDFWTLGACSEANALAMHALMLSTTPPIIYSQAATLDYMRQVWRARAEGLGLFFTQDAGPNLKLLFLAKDEARVKELFSEVEIIAPFATVEQMECIYD